MSEGLSPFTGLTRDHWAGTADSLLLSLRPWASPDHARIDLPGRSSRYGPDSDALEGFARTFLLAAIRLRGEDGQDPHDFAGWYAEGLRAGTDPASPTAWPRPDRLGQAKVEACSIALGLHLSRQWLWDRLDDRTRRHIVDWLSTVVGEDYPPINWVWFQIVVETFLRSVDGPWSGDDIEKGLAVHESLYREAGWYADGTERSYDHYNGWALHVYPLLWADMAPDLCPPELRKAWAERLSAFLDDAAKLVGANGSPLMQGRSLIYRFAAAAPFWVGAITGETELSPGLLRRTCSGMLRHFTDRGVPDERGLLSIGWYDEWPAMAQSYSGPGSPYWAVKGMLGLALPADHPVWTAVEEPLPVERADVLSVLEAPGWLVSGTKSDGIVRVINHGTDHSVPDDDRADSPLYARLGYSTATLPPLAGDAAERPRDNSVTLVHPDLGASHRNGFETLELTVDPGPARAVPDAGTAGAVSDTGTARAVSDTGTARAVSRARAHWVGIEHDSPDHGSGRSGVVTWGPSITVGSLVRGACEVRAVRVDAPAPGEGDQDGVTLGTAHLELSGWPVASTTSPTTTAPGTVRTEEITSSVVSIAGFESAAIHREQGTNPLAEHVAVPLARTSGPPIPGVTYVACVLLHGSRLEAAVPQVEITANVVVVTWADGIRSTMDLPA